MTTEKKIMYLGLGALAGWGAWMWANKTCYPKKTKLLEDFDLTRYLGKWYEIARLDFRHERNLGKVTAQYYQLPGNKYKVINRGQDVTTGDWKQSIGNIKAVDVDSGRLKVSFFGPFYSGYTVAAIDEAYKYALVFGDNLDYMWILSRTKNIPAAIKQSYLQIAADAGYDIDALVWTKQK